ncbi:hypothetical protein [Pseudomonas sp. H1h]|uniref:hypothetical protein n=1 Tax=Pseudomonas sp. H1h TaxID=1397280 RepID=UPI0012FF1B4B|nr:hypothetical protein [Pseudomonas sp. H1h]
MDIYYSKLLFVALPALLLLLYIGLGLFDQIRPKGVVWGAWKTHCYSGAMGFGAGISLVFVVTFLLRKTYPGRLEIYVFSVSLLNAYLYTATALIVNVRYFLNRRQKRAEALNASDQPPPI